MTDSATIDYKVTAHRRVPVPVSTRSALFGQSRQQLNSFSDMRTRQGRRTRSALTGSVRGPMLSAQSAARSIQARTVWALSRGRLLEQRDIAAVDVLSPAFAGDPLLGLGACSARERADSLYTVGCPSSGVVVDHATSRELETRRCADSPAEIIAHRDTPPASVALYKTRSYLSKHDALTGRATLR